MKYLKGIVCLNLLAAEAFCSDPLPPLEEVSKGEYKQVRIPIIRPIPIPAHKVEKHLQAMSQKHRQEQKSKKNVLTKEEVLEINIKHVIKTLQKWSAEDIYFYGSLVDLSELFAFDIDIRKRIRADMVTYLKGKGYTEESALEYCAPIPSTLSASFSESELPALAPLKALKQKPEMTKKIPNSPIAKRTNSRSDVAENQKSEICKSLFSYNYKPLRFKITHSRQHAKKYMR